MFEFARTENQISLQEKSGSPIGRLDQAVKLKYIVGNVSDNCDLPATVKKEMQPIKDGNLRTFLDVSISGHFALNRDFALGYRLG